MAQRDFVWAVDENGKPCKCYALPENRGKKNCKHQFHAEPGQSPKEFFKQHSISGIGASVKEEPIPAQEEATEISQEEINQLATRIDEICGTHVTPENYSEVIEKLTPEQLDELSRVGFEAAPQFSLPITDEGYGETNSENKIYFSELPDYKIGGKANAIQSMFGSVGQVPAGQETVDIQGNYRDGLTDEEYFARQFGVRGSLATKTTSVSQPGHAIFVDQIVEVA